MSSIKYQRLTVTSGEHHFCLYCTEDSLQNRRDEILLWADQLANRLSWKQYDTEITPATEAQAHERIYALFEHRFPAS